MTALCGVTVKRTQLVLLLPDCAVTKAEVISSNVTANSKTSQPVQKLPGEFFLRYLADSVLSYSVSSLSLISPSLDVTMLSMFR